MNGLVMGDYVIGSRVGSGGVGDVYRATDSMLDREVAIKFLRPGFGTQPELVQRFRAEARALAQLHHPNIATLYALHREGDTLAMVMELVDGCTVSRLLASNGALPLPVALAIFLQALDGIGCAHTHGVIHRDVKPSNLMLNRSSVLKVMDFGIARCAGTSRVTRAGNTVGTAQYMSPEQVQGRETDARSDIYSLCVVLYEMLTNQLPFDGNIEYEVMRSHIESPPPPPREIDPEIPAAIEEAILRGMAKDPKDRFPSTDALRDALLRATLESLELTASDLGAMLLEWGRRQFSEEPSTESGEATESSATALVLQTSTGISPLGTASVPGIPHDRTLDEAFAMLERSSPVQAALDAQEVDEAVPEPMSSQSPHPPPSPKTTVWELPDEIQEAASPDDGAAPDISELPTTVQLAANLEEPAARSPEEQPATFPAETVEQQPAEISELATIPECSPQQRATRETPARTGLASERRASVEPRGWRSRLKTCSQATAAALIALSMGAPRPLPQNSTSEEPQGEERALFAARSNALEGKGGAIRPIHLPLAWIDTAAVRAVVPQDTTPPGSVQKPPAAPQAASPRPSATKPPVRRTPRRSPPRQKPPRPTADEGSHPKRFVEPVTDAEDAPEEEAAGEWVLRR